jgi:hypothetical protein
MKSLLDTHVLLWMLEQPERLSPQSQALLDEDGNLVFVGVVLNEKHAEALPFITGTAAQFARY